MASLRNIETHFVNMHKTGFQGGICFKPDNGGKLQQKGRHIDTLLLSGTDPRPNTQTLVECYDFQASEIGHDFQVVFHGTEDRSNVDSILRFLKHFALGFVNLDRYHLR